MVDAQSGYFDRSIDLGCRYMIVLGIVTSHICIKVIHFLCKVVPTSELIMLHVF